jgi:hypothetical protein
LRGRNGDFDGRDGTANYPPLNEQSSFDGRSKANTFFVVMDRIAHHSIITLAQIRGFACYFS